jgi:hypothetical protein
VGTRRRNGANPARGLTANDLRSVEQRVRTTAREAILAAGGTDREFRTTWERMTVLAWHIADRERRGEPGIAEAAARVVDAWKLGDAFH